MDSSIYITIYFDLHMMTCTTKIMHEDVYEFLLFVACLKVVINICRLELKEMKTSYYSYIKLLKTYPFLYNCQYKNLIWTNNKLSIETLKANKLSKIICCLLMKLSLNCRYIARMLSNIKAYAYVVVIIVMMLNQLLGHNISNLQFSNSQPYYTSIVSIGPWQ